MNPMGRRMLPFRTCRLSLIPLSARQTPTAHNISSSSSLMNHGKISNSEVLRDGGVCSTKIEHSRLESRSRIAKHLEEFPPLPDLTIPSVAYPACSRSCHDVHLDKSEAFIDQDTTTENLKSKLLYGPDIFSRVILAYVHLKGLGDFLIYPYPAIPF